MKVIIAGSRSAKNYTVLEAAIEKSVFLITEVVSGGAFGADRLGEMWAQEHSIPVVRFLPDWQSYGNSAGPIHNRQMAEYADALIALWDGESKGTRNMIHEIRRVKKPYWVEQA